MGFGPEQCLERLGPATLARQCELQPVHEDGLVSVRVMVRVMVRVRIRVRVRVRVSAGGA